MIFMRKYVLIAFVACHTDDVTADYFLAKLNIIIAFFVHR